MSQNNTAFDMYFSDIMLISIVLVQSDGEGEYSLHKEREMEEKREAENRRDYHKYRL